MEPQKIRKFRASESKETEPYHDNLNQADRDRYIEKMTAEGFTISIPDRFTLQLDIDTMHSETILHEHLDILEKELGPIKEIKETQSKGGNKHFYIKLHFMISDIERIALQAALGSDPKRELLSFIRYKNGVINPSILVEKKGEE